MDQVIRALYQIGPSTIIIDTGDIIYTRYLRPDESAMPKTSIRKTIFMNSYDFVSGKLDKDTATGCVEIMSDSEVNDWRDIGVEWLELEEFRNVPS